MARDFEVGTSDYVEKTSAIVSAYPFSFGCWIKPESVAAGAILSIAVSGSTDNYWKLEISGSNVIRFRTRASAANSDALTAATVSVGTWYYVGLTATSATSRAVFLGTDKGTNTTNKTPTGMDRTSIGRSAESTGNGYFDGIISQPCIWNVALSDADHALLAGGDHPLSVQNGSIVSYWPFNGGSPELDSVGSNNLTVGGSAVYTNTEAPVDHRGSITKQDIALASLAIGATTTTSSGNTSAIPLSAITVDKFAASAATTELHQSTVPLKAIALQGYAIAAQTSDQQVSALPLKDLALVAYAPTATVTTGNSSAIPTEALSLATYPISSPASQVFPSLTLKASNRILSIEAEGKSLERPSINLSILATNKSFRIKASKRSWTL